MKSFLKLALVFTFLMSTLVVSANTYNCKSLDSFKEKVEVTIKVNGHRALVSLDLDGVKTNSTASIKPWNNITPNRCGSYASGFEFKLPLPNVHHLHIVTQVSGRGCYAPSTISYDGIEWAGIYLECTEATESEL